MTLSEAAYKNLLRQKDEKIKQLQDHIRDMENGRKAVYIENLRNRIKELEAKCNKCTLQTPKKCSTCEDFNPQRYIEANAIIESKFGWCKKHSISMTKSSGCVG